MTGKLKRHQSDSHISSVTDLSAPRGQTVHDDESVVDNDLGLQTSEVT